MYIPALISTVLSCISHRLDRSRARSRALTHNLQTPQKNPLAPQCPSVQVWKRFLFQSRPQQPELDFKLLFPPSDINPSSPPVRRCTSPIGIWSEKWAMVSLSPYTQYDSLYIYVKSRASWRGEQICSERGSRPEGIFGGKYANAWRPISPRLSVFMYRWIYSIDIIKIYLYM